MKKQSSSCVNLISLLNDGEYHDGTSIGKKLEITRSAVWKTIKKLESYGIKINSIKGKGYSLLEPLILLDEKKIKKNLSHKNIDLNLFETISSTNSYIKKNANRKKISICLAEHQTEGKGRFNREWRSPFAQNIYLSCFYPFNTDVSTLTGLSLVVGLAILKTLSHYKMQHSFLIKWPNDIYYEDQKISGNLIELQAEAHGLCDAIIGIGINVNMLEENIPQKWTSLRKISDEYIDRNVLSATLINILIDYLEKFKEQGLKAFLSEWKKADYLANKQITLKQANAEINGKVLGIDSLGYLVMQLANGDKQSFSAGDTTVLK